MLKIKKHWNTCDASPCPSQMVKARSVCDFLLASVPSAFFFSSSLFQQLRCVVVGGVRVWGTANLHVQKKKTGSDFYNSLNLKRISFSVFAYDIYLVFLWAIRWKVLLQFASDECNELLIAFSLGFLGYLLGRTYAVLVHRKVCRAVGLR